MDFILKVKIINSLGTFVEYIKSLEIALALGTTIIILKGA